MYILIMTLLYCLVITDYLCKVHMQKNKIDIVILTTFTSKIYKR